MVTDIPRWNIRVDGRKFSKYRQLSQKKPRRTLLGLPVADPVLAVCVHGRHGEYGTG